MIQQWTKMPSGWTREENGTLRLMKWGGSSPSDQIAALMLYIVLCSFARVRDSASDLEVGGCTLTYDRLSHCTGLSRAKVSGGLKLLEGYGLISKSIRNGKSYFVVSNFGSDSGWAKLPVKGVFTADGVHRFFTQLHLRKKVELNALKLYLIILAFRDNRTCSTSIGYEKISLYTGIPRGEICPAISLLVANDMIRVDRIESISDSKNLSNQYRIRHLDNYIHNGNQLNVGAN